MKSAHPVMDASAEVKGMAHRALAMSSILLSKMGVPVTFSPLEIYMETLISIESYASWLSTGQYFVM